MAGHAPVLDKAVQVLDPGDDWDDLSASMVADIVDQPLEAIFSHRFRPQRWLNWLNHEIKTKCGWIIHTP